MNGNIIIIQRTRENRFKRQSWKKKKEKKKVLNRAPAGPAARERAEHPLHARVHSGGRARALASRSAKTADLEARQRFLLQASLLMLFPFRKRKIRMDRWLSPLKGSSPAHPTLPLLLRDLRLQHLLAPQKEMLSSSPWAAIGVRAPI